MAIERLISKLSKKYEVSHISGDSFWDLNLSLSIDTRNYEVKPIQKIEDLEKFGQSLSNLSKDMFCPFPWNNQEKAIPAFREFIQNHKEKRDLSYFIFDDSYVPIGLFFLWNVKSAIPELGEGIIDTYHSRGLGGFALDMLTEIADILKVDAVELTTDLRNDIAKHLYESRGYEELGIIRNPLEVDQTQSLDELKDVEKFRDEYHMARVFRNRDEVLETLKKKREDQSKL